MPGFDTAVLRPWSHNRASAAECPRKLWARYVGGRPRAPSGDAARRGAAVHAAAERVLLARASGAAEPDLRAELRAAARRERVSDRDVLVYARAARTALDAEAGRAVAGVELPVAMLPRGECVSGHAAGAGRGGAWAPGAVWVGFVDAVFDDGDALRVVDWKTSTSPYDGDRVAGLRAQLEPYAAVLGVERERPVRAEAVVLTSTSVRPQRIAVAVPDPGTVLLALRRRVDALEDGAVRAAGRGWPARPGPSQCRFCDFREECSERWGG